MSTSWRSVGTSELRERPGEVGPGVEATDELERLRRENRRLAVSLGSFSAFIASKGMLEEAWSYVNAIHQMDDD
jgi:transposase-like protein